MTSTRTADLIEESDRGCVLIGAAVLESRLEGLFRDEFEANGIPKKVQESMFDSNGPLSTFSSKIKLAYSLGFLRKEMFEDLDTIRKIRNEFAHSHGVVDFIGHEVSKVIESMHCVRGIKNKFPRFSLNLDDQVPSHMVEAQTRMMGYVKATKGIFSLGVKNLESELVETQHAMAMSRNA